MPSYEAIQNILTLYKVDPRTGFPTGEVKPNVPEDPDYIAPIEGGTCPVIYTEWVPTDPSCETNYIFENVLLCDDFTKSDCPEHYHGSVETYCVPAGTYFSALSQEDADQKALDDIAANGQAYANANGTCIPDTYAFKWIVDPSSNYCQDDSELL